MVYEYIAVFKLTRQELWLRILLKTRVPLRWIYISHRAHSFPQTHSCTIRIVQGWGPAVFRHHSAYISLISTVYSPSLQLELG